MFFLWLPKVCQKGTFARRKVQFAEISHLVATAWAQIRDKKNKEVDWVILGYDGNSKTDITVLTKGNGGMQACSASLPENDPCFGGLQLSTERFVGFFHAPYTCPAMKKGRASMHKNGVLNVLEGRDGEFEMTPGMAEKDIAKIF